MASTHGRFTVLSGQGWDFPFHVALGRMVDVGSHPEIFWCWNWRQVALSMRCAGAEPVGGQYAGRRHFGNAAVTGVFTPTARGDYWSQPRQMRQANEKDRPLYYVPGSSCLSTGALARDLDHQ